MISSYEKMLEKRLRFLFISVATSSNKKNENLFFAVMDTMHKQKK